MKNGIKLIFFCLMFLAFPVISKANNIEITGLESFIKIDKNRVASVTENYDIYFIDNTKEIKRTIDTSLEIKRKKDSKTVIKPTVSKLVSNGNFNIENTDKTTTIVVNKKGKKDTLDTLEIHYQYDLGKDTASSYDEFYYNIISNFDSIISDVSFEIEVPLNEIDLKNVSFILNGEYVDSEFLTIDVEKNVITGYLNKVLNENDTFAVRIEFPNGFFEGAKDNFNYLNYLILIFPITGLFLVIISWFKYAKGNIKKREYSYYPPCDFDSAEIGYLYKGKMLESDITTLIIDFANKGYLRIEENDDGYKLGKENSFKFIKLKEYKGRNAVKKIIFKGIFKDREISEMNDIEYTIKNNLMDAKEIIDNTDNKKKLFNVDINIPKRNIMILTIISVLLLTINPVKEFTNSYLFVPILTLTMLFGLSILSIINVRIMPKIILSFIFVFGTSFLNIYSLLGQTNALYIYIIGDVIIILTALIYSKLPARTKYGNKNLGLIEGFKLSLENMDEIKLEELINENPNYYYDMLPYVFVFDIVDKWTILGKNIVGRPSWHISIEKYDIKKEMKFMKNLIYVTTQIMIKGIYMQKESQQLEFKKDVPVLKKDGKLE